MSHEGEPKLTPQEIRTLYETELGKVAEKNDVTGEGKEEFVQNVMRRVLKSPIEDTGVGSENVINPDMTNITTEGKNVVPFKEQHYADTSSIEPKGNK